MANLSQVDKMKLIAELYPHEAQISFSGAEDVLVIEYAKQAGVLDKIGIFSLDTGRLHPQTYRFFSEVEKHYGVNVNYCFPRHDAMQKLVREKGMFSFMEDGHKECCTIRKVEPLERQLGTMKAWITGLRADQNQTRENIPFAEWDARFKLVKFNPMASATCSDVWDALRKFKVPTNELHTQGYVSIGCEPCTRPISPCMHEREGRWWWENPGEKECGLHKKDDVKDFLQKGPTPVRCSTTGECLPLSANPANVKITMVKKITKDGKECKKCTQVGDMIKADGLQSMFPKVVLAYENDENSEGMRLSKKHEMETAPFFIVEETVNGQTKASVFNSYLKLRKSYADLCAHYKK
jgi:adenylyl-sulfate reductase (glutathione)